MRYILVDSGSYLAFIEEYFKTIPQKVDRIDGKYLTSDSFLQLFGSKEASIAKNVVYIWQTERPMPRIQGESNILYIGQTKRSLKSRHAPSVGIKAKSEANKRKFNYIVEKYGAISVSYLEINSLTFDKPQTLRELEGQLLWWYFQNHSEYPPNNYTKTKNRNKSLAIL